MEDIWKNHHCNEDIEESLCRGSTRIFQDPKGGKSIVKLLNPHQKYVCKMKVNDELIYQKEGKSCDYLGIVIENRIGYFIELKDDNLNTAIEQLENSLKVIHECSERQKLIENLQRIKFIIILTRRSHHQKDRRPEERLNKRLKEKLKNKFHSPIIVQSREYSETI